MLVLFVAAATILAVKASTSLDQASCLASLPVLFWLSSLCALLALAFAEVAFFSN